MIYVWATVLTLLNAVWLFLVVLGLPGTWLMVISVALAAWWHWDGHAGVRMFGLTTLSILVALAFIGEILEFVAGVFGSKRAGGTRGGAIGALIGGLVGALAGTGLIPIPVLGSLIGACGGAFLGALSMELMGGRSMEASMRSGMGAGVGRFFGTVAKLGVGIAIWVVAAVAAFWP